MEKQTVIQHHARQPRPTCDRWLYLGLGLLVVALSSSEAVRTIRAAWAQSAIEKLKAGGAMIQYDDDGAPVWLSVTHNQIQNKELEYVRGLSTLQSVSLWDCKLITDRGLQPLGELQNLEQLDLANMNTTDEGLVHLAGMVRLTELNLSGTAVTDAGMKHLQGLRSLEWLRLNETDITDAGIDALAGLPSLKVLTLVGTRCTPQGIQRLKILQPRLSIIQAD